MYDILGLGGCAIDDFILVERFPESGEKTPMQARFRQNGGLTGTALVAAARFGANCAYAGQLGEDELSFLVRENFDRHGIDLTYSRTTPSAGVVYAIVVVDRTTAGRTIFFQRPEVSGAHPEWPPEDVIAGSKVLFVDHFGVPGMIRAAGVARSAGIPVVSDVERSSVPRTAELLGLVDHLVTSKRMALELSGEGDPAAAARALLPGRAAVVVTCGEAGGWFVDAVSPMQVQPYRAVAVEAVDTTGCGDVFHGVYLATLARGLPLAERVRLASAAAALKATRPGGQSGIADEAAVRRLLKAGPGG